MARVLALTSQSSIKVNSVLSALPIASALVDAVLPVASPAAASGRPAQPIVSEDPESWGGYAVAWQRLQDAIVAGAKISSARYWLSIENVACKADLTTRSGPLSEVACGVLFDSWTGVILHASSRPVLIPAVVYERYFQQLEAFSQSSSPPPGAGVWTLGHAAVEVLAPSPAVQHDDWIGAAEVLAAQPEDGQGFRGGRAEQIKGVTVVLLSQLQVRAREIPVCTNPFDPVSPFPILYARRCGGRTTWRLRVSLRSGAYTITAASHLSTSRLPSWTNARRSCSGQRRSSPRTCASSVQTPRARLMRAPAASGLPACRRAGTCLRPTCLWPSRRWVNRVASVVECLGMTSPLCGTPMTPPLL